MNPLSGVLGEAWALYRAHFGHLITIAGVSATTMHIPVIIGAVLEGPVVGALIGLVFGVTSLIRAAVAPNGPIDPLFINPLLSVLPRLFIGPAAWLVWRALRRWPVVGLAGLARPAVSPIPSWCWACSVCFFPPISS